MTLVLGAETQPIKKQRGGRGLGLRWLPFGLGKHNNQPKVGVCCGEDIGEGARPRWNVWGERFTIVWGGERKTKK